MSTEKLNFFLFKNIYVGEECLKQTYNGHSSGVY